MMGAVFVFDDSETALPLLFFELLFFSFFWAAPFILEHRVAVFAVARSEHTSEPWGWLDQNHSVEMHHCSWRRTRAGFTMHRWRNTWREAHVSICVSHFWSAILSAGPLLNLINISRWILKLPNASHYFPLRHSLKKSGIQHHNPVLWDISGIIARKPIYLQKYILSVTDIRAFFFSLFT